MLSQCQVCRWAIREARMWFCGNPTLRVETDEVSCPGYEKGTPVERLVKVKARLDKAGA